MLHRSAALLLVGSLLPVLGAAPAAPAAPAAYHVRVRYRIDAYRSERIRQYREMMDYLARAGFERDADDEPREDEADNRELTRMRGVVPAAGLGRLLRQRHILALLAYPKGTRLPEKAARVRVDIQLASGFQPETQRRLHEQTAKVLAAGAGFVEAVGYDRRGGARLVGGVPGGSLERLLGDTRTLKAAADEGPPLRSVSPVRLVVARPDWPVPPGQPAAPAVPENQRKLTPELRELLAGAGATAPTRLEVILGWTPPAGDRTWRRALDLPGVTVEGRLGPLVTVVGRPKEVAATLAALEGVAHVRLPRPARVPPRVSTDPVDLTFDPLRASGVARLHKMGRRGKGTRAALIADDFTGWEKLRGRKEAGRPLPDPTLLDMTVERNRDLVPDPSPAGGESAGARCAALLLRAAPEVELTLIRIDPAAPHMLEEAARAINGEVVLPITLGQRFEELRVDRATLERRAAALAEERRGVFDRVRDDEEWVKGRDAYQARQAALERDEAAHQRREARYFAYLRGLRGLKGVRVVASTLVWSEGYPVDGSSALSRYFDDRPFRAALWFQAAGDANGQAWSGPFRDADGNGRMEFLAPGERLPDGLWTPELNFLGWRNRGAGAAGATLPAGARVRISLQWREAHDALPLRLGEDPYREPLTRLRLVVVAQPDPEGKARPADDLEVVAQSAALPTRLDQTANAATYEHAVELKVPRAGRYAVFIEGKPPESVHAPGENHLPATRKVGEVRPRLFVQTLAGDGRAVWAGFTTAAASLGMPADAQAVLTVAAADGGGRVRASSAAGSPHGLPLRVKPDVLSYDGGGGTPQAASFAAGVVGAAWPTTGTLFGALDGLRVRPDEVLRLPRRGK